VRAGVNTTELNVKGLNDIASQTVSQLEEIWNEVGCNRDEREQHLQGERCFAFPSVEKVCLS